MKLIGAAFVLLAALLFSTEARRRAEKRLLVLEETLRFIEHVRVDISCYLKPISEIPAGFFSEALSEAGFLSAFEKEGAYEACLKLETLLSPSPEEKRVLERFFCGLGRGYSDDQIKLIDETTLELTRLISLERERVPKVKKLSLTLSSAGALALIIFFL